MIKIIFCALNEEQNLKKLLLNLSYEMEILQKKFEIIICLDGTNDKSLEVIEQFKRFFEIKVLPQENKRGLGFAYKKLFLEVIRNSCDDDLIISLDADNTHNPKQIGVMITNFKKHSLDFLVASRFCDNSVMKGFPIYRRLVSKSTSLLLQWIFPIQKISGKKLQDYTSGYRIYRAKKLKELFKKEGNNFIIEPEFTYTCELLIKLSYLNCRIDEMPISYDYQNKIGNSRLRIIRNLFRLLIMVSQLFCRKKSGQNLDFKDHL
jgi:dolichol-phosphate mannosyltransferase